jgi:hypothetical protein
VVGALALLVASRHRGSVGLLAAAVMAIPALVVPTWLVLLNNHSQIHHFFVYRTVPAALGVVLAACVFAAWPLRTRAGAIEPRGQGMSAYLVEKTARTRFSSNGSPSQSKSPRNMPGSST